jgi:hypothetical protein
VGVVGRAAAAALSRVKRHSTQQAHHKRGGWPGGVVAASRWCGCARERRRRSQAAASTQARPARGRAVEEVWLVGGWLVCWLAFAFVSYIYRKQLQLYYALQLIEQPTPITTTTDETDDVRRRRGGDDRALVVTGEWCANEFFASKYPHRTPCAVAARARYLGRVLSAAALLYPPCVRWLRAVVASSL